MAIIPTVWVRCKDPEWGPFKLNESDFDPEVHELVDPHGSVVEAESADGEAVAGDEPVTVEDLEPTEPPPGYDVARSGGAYYRVRAPDGSKLEGPHRGKFHGEGNAIYAAWDHWGAGNTDGEA